MEKKQLRKKSEILETLPYALSKGDKKHVKELYSSFGNLIENGYPDKNNPATYVGWLKLEDGSIVKLEAEERKSYSGNIGLALKGTTIPKELAKELDLVEKDIPDYKSENTVSFLKK